MPLYLYRCRRCELELEELHPLGQAPPESIRCPLCGGYFTREFALFSIGGRVENIDLREPSKVIRHGVNCPCCAPRR
jgi:putative FmdB family regulatory protein